jgi:PAS domain S-box-containing protein
MSSRHPSAATTASAGGRAKRRLPRRRAPSRAGVKDVPAEAQRLLHELQVHQVELETQNAELEQTRNRSELLLEKYTDLYDFAPVGYFSVDQGTRIVEVNLTGATLLGVERSRLQLRPMLGYVARPSQAVFLAFLERVFAVPENQSCEVALRRADGTVFWGHIQGMAALPVNTSKDWCRLAVSDITTLKQAQEAQGRMEAMTKATAELKREIASRRAVEEELRASEAHQRQLLNQSRETQEQLRHLSHRILHAQEEERKRISRELHDDITQTLVGINVSLASLAREATVNPRELRRKIARTQRLVAKSVDIVHRFARELRPTSLDDLGLIASLHSLMNDFAKRTRLHVHLTTFAGVEQMSGARRTALYRVVHSALTNVARHAEATRVTVTIEKIHDFVRMEITDNGKSFDLKQVSRRDRNKHLGLLGMRERVEMVGGTLSVESGSGRGTTIRAQIPFGRGRKLNEKISQPVETTL